MSTINVGQSLQSFKQDKWYAYSGIVTGDVSVPATITLIDIPSTGLQGSFIKIQPNYGLPISNNTFSQIGIAVLIDGVEVIKSQKVEGESDMQELFEIFVPQQSRLQVLSLNTALNNTQERGVTVLGWYV